MLRRVARFISGRLLPRRAYTVLRGPMKGSRFILGSLSGEGGGASVYLGEMEPEQTATMAEAMRPGNVFFDIGANVGYYTILASRLVGEAGKVVAFEPVPRNIEFLRQHIEINTAANVILRPQAVSGTKGTVRFSLGPDSAMGHIGVADEGDGELEVETTTLDDVVSELGIAPDVMKIDVEGAEREVFLGAARMFETARPVIFLSTHSDELRAWCLEHLRGLGYAVRPLIAGEDGHEFVATHD
ncbi:MAG: FkbM family methyltransferase [Acidobacteria bacterium]|nr:FkbM family methyltransferase [Acidobacteriota bacterium]